MMTEKLSYIEFHIPKYFQFIINYSLIILKIFLHFKKAC